MRRHLLLSILFATLSLEAANAERTLTTIGDWQVSEERSDLDGATSVSFMIQSREAEPNDIGVPTFMTMTLLCRRGRPGAVIQTPRFLNSSTSLVTWRSGASGLYSERWASPRGVAILSDPILAAKLVNSLDDRGDLIVRVGEGQEASFPIGGAAQIAKLFSGACPPR